MGLSVGWLVGKGVGASVGWLVGDFVGTNVEVVGRGLPSCSTISELGLTVVAAMAS